MTEKKYPPIGDYAFIADCHSAALVSRSGSIDWCCMPQIDSGTCFARLLDWERGGYFAITPTAGHQADRDYRGDSLILETSFRTEKGTVRLTDCFTMKKGGKHDPFRQVLRTVEGVRGEVELSVTYFPCFDYGSVKTWIHKAGGGDFMSFGGQDSLLLSSRPEVALEVVDRHRVETTFTIREGETVHFSMIWARPELMDEGLVTCPDAGELSARFEGTAEWWRTWTSSSETSDRHFEKASRRSALVLKGLNYSPTGAIAAAATTSLPETPGGGRNWDYRYSWIRDSCFTVRALGELGYRKEAEGFGRFIERSAAGSAEELQVLFGVTGKRRLEEYEVPELDGWRGARPVRIGNAAQNQLQLDMYGDLLELAWSLHGRGRSPDEEYMRFLADIVETTIRDWQKPDRGIWELRGKPRHCVHSKVMCWVALDRGIRLAEATGYDAPLDGWRKTAETIRSDIEKNGVDAGRGVFVQAYGYPQMDASLLLIPLYGFVGYTDPVMMKTVDRIREELEKDGLILRYPEGTDELEGGEGVFIPCTFWLAECLARQGRIREAKNVFRQALATGNDLRLFSEEYDTETFEMLGNYPQALTHLSLITAEVAIGEAERKRA